MASARGRYVENARLWTDVYIIESRERLPATSTMHATTRTIIYKYRVRSLRPTLLHLPPPNGIVVAPMRSVHVRRRVCVVCRDLRRRLYGIRWMVRATDSHAPLALHWPVSLSSIRPAVPIEDIAPRYLWIVGRF